METALQVKNGTASGTTTAAYVEVLRVDTRGCGPQGKMIIVIKNTGASYDLTYKIDGYPYDYAGTLSGLSIALKSATYIGETAQVTNTDVAYNLAAVVVSVISKEATATTYQIDWTTI